MNRIVGTVLLLISSLAIAEELKMWVASSVKAGMFEKIKEPFEKKTGIKIIYAGDTTRADSTNYFIDLIENKVEASTTSLGYEEWAANVKKKGIQIPADITHRVIGNDLMNVFINPKLGIKKLTHDQLNDLCTGKITNWKAVGGPDQEVVTALALNKTATNTSFQKMVMKGAKFGGKIYDKLETFEGVIDYVAKTPGAIGFTPGTIWSDKATEIETDPIGRPITLITRGRPSKKLQTLLDFIATEGKNLGVGRKGG